MAGSTPEPPVWRWEGDDLVVPAANGVESSRCLLCGGADDVRRWVLECADTPVWRPVAYLIEKGLFPSLARTRRERVGLTRCGSCKAAMTQRLVVSWVVGAGGAGGLPLAGGALGLSLGGWAAVRAGLAVGLAGWVVALGLLVAWDRRRRVRCRRIEGRSVRLAFADPAAAREALRDVDATERAWPS